MIKMKKQYLIYADESHRKGKYFSNFYGGALIDCKKLENINKKLNNKKIELGLLNEVKWTKVSERYLDKYIELINYFFNFIKNNDIKIRIMFRQNTVVPKNLTRENEEKEYFLLISTGIKGDLSNYWKNQYRHWSFKARDNTFDPTLTKKAK